MESKAIIINGARMCYTSYAQWIDHNEAIWESNKGKRRAKRTKSK